MQPGTKRPEPTAAVRNAAGSPHRWWQVDPDHWRDQVLGILLLGIVVLSPLVYLPSVIIAFRQGLSGIVILDTLAVLSVAFLYFRTSLSVRFRTGALMVIFYVLGVGLHLAVGPISQIYLLGFAVMTTLLLGLRSGIAAMVLNGVTLFAIGAVGFVAPSVADGGDSLSASVVLTVNFLMVNAVLVLSLGAIIATLERAITAGSEAQDQLALERTDLLVANDALATEVVERRRAEKQLQESEARYRTLFDANPQPVWVYDPETLRFLEVNSSAVSHYGYSRADFLSMRIEDLLPEDVQRPVGGENRDASAEETGIQRHRRQDGSIIDVEITSHAIDLLGRPARVVLANDVSARIQAEAVLAETSARLYGVMHHSPLLISLLDSEGRCILANRAQAAALGREVAEVVGSFINDLLKPSQVEALGARLAKVRASREPLTVRDEIDIGSGPRSYSTVYFPLFGTDGEITSVCSIAQDISEQVRAETERARLEAKLFESQRMESVGRLAGGVAHDFNNMLGVILGYTDLISSDPSVPEAVRGDLEEVRAAARHSAQLTKQLLAFARQQTISPEVLDLNETVGAMLKMLRRLIGEDVHLVWSPAETLWPVRVDPVQIDQVLANLVVNARDAIGPAGTITISTGQAEIDEEYCAVHPDFIPGEYTVVSVADDGHGMDRATLERIFDPFFTTKPKGQGTGLGLATVYGVARQNNGFVRVYSEPGHGTAFRIYLPRHHGAMEEGYDARPRPPLPTGNETILVVEDEHALLTMTTKMLKGLNYNVLAASTPGEALRIASEHPGTIDLLVTDVIMPEINGLDLQRRLLEIRPGMKSLFMSGYTADIIARHGVLDDGIEFLEKPFTKADMASKVRAVLTAR